MWFDLTRYLNMNFEVCLLDLNVFVCYSENFVTINKIQILCKSENDGFFIKNCFQISNVDIIWTPCMECVLHLNHICLFYWTSREIQIISPKASSNFFREKCKSLFSIIKKFILSKSLQTTPPILVLYFWGVLRVTFALKYKNLNIFIKLLEGFNLMSISLWSKRKNQVFGLKVTFLQWLFLVWDPNSTYRFVTQSIIH